MLPKCCTLTALVMMHCGKRVNKNVALLYKPHQFSMRCDGRIELRAVLLTRLLLSQMPGCPILKTYMNDDQLNELKQFITDTVSTQVAGVRSDVHGLETRLTNRIDGIEAKIDDIQDAVGDAIILATDTLDGQLQDHEHRLTVLERQAA